MEKAGSAGATSVAGREVAAPHDSSTRVPRTPTPHERADDAEDLGGDDGHRRTWSAAGQGGRAAWWRMRACRITSVAREIAHPVSDLTERGAARAPSRGGAPTGR